MQFYTDDNCFVYNLQVVRQKVLPKEIKDYGHHVNLQINHLHDGMPKK